MCFHSQNIAFVVIDCFYLRFSCHIRPMREIEVMQGDFTLVIKSYGTYPVCSTVLVCVVVNAVWPAARVLFQQLYAPQTKILEDWTKDRSCRFEVLCKGESTLFGQWLVEQPCGEQKLRNFLLNKEEEHTWVLTFGQICTFELYKSKWFKVIVQKLPKCEYSRIRFCVVK